MVVSTEVKTCTSCGHSKSILEFYLTANRNGAKRRHSKCQPCRRAQFTEYAKTPRGREVKRNGVLAREYGLTAEQYSEMAAAQHGVCAICALPEIKVHRDGTLCRLAVDHNHATGRVRGLLCSACNVGLGSFEDSPGRLEAAANYLRSQAAKAEALEAKLIPEVVYGP